MDKQKKGDKKEEVSFGVFKQPMERREFDEILNRKVSKLGNSGHISIPSKHIGKDAQVTIWKQDEEETNFSKVKKEEDKK